MDTITIKLTNTKAYKILKNMEELNLIKVLSPPPDQKLSSLRGKIKSPMNPIQIDNQLKKIKTEWQRDI